MSKNPRARIADSDIFFRGGASMLKPNHITRYEYPCNLQFPLSTLRIQTPVNASKRSRPQGQGRAHFGIEGSTYLTVTRSYRNAPTSFEFEDICKQEKEQDTRSPNALGRALSRMTKYAGNTLLQSGKFMTKEGLMYIIKRTTMIRTTENSFFRDEATYEISCKQWRAMRPPSEPEYDSWWMRFQNLYQSSTDRAYWSTRETMDKYGIAAPLATWLPRPDVEDAVTVHRVKVHISDAVEEQCCLLCSREWWIDSEYACELKCGHWLCYECVIRKVDDAGRGNVFDGEKVPGGKYWRCPYCQMINSVLVDRADIIAADELPYWRYKIARYRLETFTTDWLTHLYVAEMIGWCAELPLHLQGSRADPKEVVKARVVYVRPREAVEFMENVPILVAGLLSWGFSMDNPVNKEEGDLLKACMIADLQQLGSSKRMFHTEELIEHIKQVGDGS
jgi:hypothetical protein